MVTGNCGSNNSNNHNNNNSNDVTPNRSPLVDTDSDKGGHSHSDQTSPPLQYRQATANITDYSPEWAYPEVTYRLYFFFTFYLMLIFVTISFQK